MTDQQIDNLIKHAEWSQAQAPFTNDHDAKAVEGKAFGFTLLAVEFDIEDQGFPPGACGYDGTIVSPDGVVQRLTREQAKTAFTTATTT